MVCKQDRVLHRWLTAAIAVGALLGGAIAGFGKSEAAEQAASCNRLKVSDDGRWLVRADGRPFFYLGDTAWELFHRLNRKEVDLYLRDCAKKGFTVIQAVVLAELDGLETPNPYGVVSRRGRERFCGESVVWFRSKGYTDLSGRNGADRVIGSGIFAAQLRGRPFPQGRSGNCHAFGSGLAA